MKKNVLNIYLNQIKKIIKGCSNIFNISAQKIFMDELIKNNKNNMPIFLQSKVLYTGKL